MADKGETRTVWKLINPKDKTREDVAMYDGRIIPYENDDLEQGHYVLTSQCVGKGLTSLRQIQIQVTVWERGEVVLKDSTSISPKKHNCVHKFKIAHKGKIHVRYAGSAAYGFANIHLKAHLERTSFSAASNISLASFASPTDSSSQTVSTLVSSIGASGVSSCLIPRFCWSRAFNEDYTEHKEFSVSIYEGMRLAGLGLRMKLYIDAETEKGKLPVMNPFKKSPAGPRMGVPLGGIGAGTIGRGWRGDFGRWTLLPGFPNYKTLEANQFSAFVSRGGKTDAAVLQTAKPSNSKLKSWKFGSFSGAKCKNYSLYPQSITQYKEPFDNITLTCRQVSPFIPHNYKESSYPVGVFEWFIENESMEEVDVALMFTFQNGMGESFDRQGGHRNIGYREKMPGTDTEVCGVQLKYDFPTHHAIMKDVMEKRMENSQDLNKRFSEMKEKDENGKSPREESGLKQSQIGGQGPISQLRALSEEEKKIHDVKDPFSFSIAVTSDDQNAILSSHNKFFIEGKDKGACEQSKAKFLWDSFAKDGLLLNMESQSPSEPGQVIGAAVAGKVTVKPGEYRRIVFSLAWDIPICRFNSGSGYFRRYTKFFGRDGNNANKIAATALAEYGSWVSQIEKWQNPILLDNNLPDWYKQTLFNELYYLVEGGSIWVGEEKVSDNPEQRKKQMSTKVPVPETETFKTIGKFGYLESLEYIMVNTYDVHFYGSWALIMLFPLLDLSLQVDFCDATLVKHDIEWRTLHSGEKAIRKVYGAVPHDLGNPGDDPWVWVNSYCIQEINSWKDLNSKLVLQIYRDFHVTKDLDFLKRCWDVIKIAVDYVTKFDKDGDGLIENEGFPDQTYDTWSATGPSAYCGGLWVAALSACEKMADALLEVQTAKKYHEMWEKAKKAYHEKLWSGEYYLYDTSDSDHFDSIQADSMCGQWWARGCGLPSISDDTCIKSSLKKIFDFNVKKFQCGQIGPINGMRPDGKIDTSCMQSVEVWTGTAYGLASAMMQEGMIEESFSTAKGISRVTYETKGYMFQTPEAWDASMNYRALAYMRPLAIWGMQYAWENGANQLRAQPNQDLLEVELADEIAAQQSTYLKSLQKSFRGGGPKEGSLPVIKVAFVGEDHTSKHKELFLACWHRYPVTDKLIEQYKDDYHTAGEEELQKGMPVRYEFYSLSCQDEKKMLEICQKATVVVCCYSVISQSSRTWMEEKFLPLVNDHFPNVPALIVATGIAARAQPAGDMPIPTTLPMTTEETKKYSIQLQKLCPNIRGHVECSPLTFKGFRTLANAGLAICLIGKVKEKEGEALPEAGQDAKKKLEAKEDQNCVVM